MSYTKIMIHAVWSTKDKEPILEKTKRLELFGHILSNAKAKGIRITEIGGVADHVHCLFELPPDIAVSKAIQLIKGESSFWANQNRVFKYRIEWADEYFAASVSESNLSKAIAYIKGQEEHHKKITFQQEYDKFIKEYKLNG